MEEVDSILIYTLKQIGCDVSSSLGDLSPTQIIKCVSRCVELIKPDVEIPPYDAGVSMSGRYKVASEIAQYISDIGYTDEIGCQSFLYPTETETRKFLIFLIERLPKDTDSELGNRIETLLSRIAQENETKAEASAIQNGLGSSSGGIRLPAAVDVDSLPKETLRFYASHLADITFAKQREKFKKLPATSQPPPPPPTQRKLVVEEADFSDEEPEPDPVIQPTPPDKPQVASKPKVPEKPKPKPQVKPKPNLAAAAAAEEEAARKKAEEEAEAQAAAALKAMQEETKAKAQDLKAKEKSVAALTQTAQGIEDEIQKLKAEEERRRKELMRLRKTKDLMEESGEAGLDKVKNAVEAQIEKILGLANKWEGIRSGLVEEIRATRDVSVVKQSETARQKEEIRSLKTQLKEMGQDAKMKEDAYAHLLIEYEKMPKDLNRSSYTKRICEIIGNIKKQKKEITKVLGDTKEIQKDINTLSGRLDRTFTVADELIFRDAERDKNVAQSYKLLVAIHSDFSRIIKVLEEIGNSKRQFRDLEDKLELEKGKNVEGKLERLRADLAQTRHDNQILQARLREPSIMAAAARKAASISSSS